MLVLTRKSDKFFRVIILAGLMRFLTTFVALSLRAMMALVRTYSLTVAFGLLANIAALPIFACSWPRNSVWAHLHAGQKNAENSSMKWSVKTIFIHWRTHLKDSLRHQLSKEQFLSIPSDNQQISAFYRCSLPDLLRRSEIRCFTIFLQTKKTKCTISELELFLRRS